MVPLQTRKQAGFDRLIRACRRCQPPRLICKRPTRAPAYDGDLSLLDSLRAIVAEPEIIARVTVGAPLSVAETPDRKALARQARDCIVTAIAG